MPRARIPPVTAHIYRSCPAPLPRSCWQHAQPQSLQSALASPTVPAADQRREHKSQQKKAVSLQPREGRKHTLKNPKNTAELLSTSSGEKMPSPPPIMSLSQSPHHGARQVLATWEWCWPCRDSGGPPTSPALRGPPSRRQMAHRLLDNTSSLVLSWGQASLLTWQWRRGRAPGPRVHTLQDRSSWGQSHRPRHGPCLLPGITTQQRARWALPAPWPTTAKHWSSSARRLRFKDSAFPHASSPA